MSFRFPDDATVLMNAFGVLGMRPVPLLPADEIDTWGNEHIDVLVQHYGVAKVHNDVVVGPIVNAEETKREWSVAKRLVRGQGYPTNSISSLWKILNGAHRDELPNLTTLAGLALIAPVHTAECERGFSVQNQIKTALRNRLSETKMDELSAVSILGPQLKHFDANAALQIWKAKKSRKIFKK